MEPAVAWYRQNGSETVLSLILIKWGTLLNPTPRFNESVGAFQEAFDIATRHGDELYQSMALQRLGGVYAQRDLRESAKYWERALVLARKIHFTLAYFQAAGNWGNLGEFAKAADLIAEGKRETAAQYRPGVDRDGLTARAHLERAELDYVQGHCAAGLRTATGSNPDRIYEILWRRSSSLRWWL